MPSRACARHLARPPWRYATPARVILPFRPNPHLRYSSSTIDPKLHPNPTASPSTDPASPAPSANPERIDTASNEHLHGAGHASPTAQSNVDPKGPNMEQLPHVTEEAAAVSKSMGESGPSVEQGTPVQDVLKKDTEAYDRLPKVMKDALKKSSSQSRSFSSSASRQADEGVGSESNGADSSIPPYMVESRSPFQAKAEEMMRSFEELESLSAQIGVPSRDEQAYPGQYHEINEEEALRIAKGELIDPLEGQAMLQVREIKRQGLKFEPPSVPLNQQKHLHRRYDGVIDQVTNMVMRHGKKSQAQKHVTDMLTHLRTAPAPTLSPPGTPRRILPLPQHTPTQQYLPLHPIFYLTFAIDSIAPLVRIRSQRGLAGGGVALQMPQPLSLRQRRRAAIVWILEAVEKRKGSTSGFAKRFAEEIVGIVEGRSSVWSKRENVHRMGVMGRSNLAMVRGGKR